MTILFTTYRRILVILATTTAAIPAAAEERASEQPAPTERARSAQGAPLRLAISGISPGAEVRVVPRSDNVAERATTCWQDCELTLRKGGYTLISSRGDDVRTKDVDLASSQIVNVGRWDGTVRTMGTVMGITGIALAALGTFVTVAIATRPGLDAGPNASTDGGAHTVIAVGFLGMIAGTGLAVGGFLMAAHNKAPSMDLERMPTPYPPPAAATGLSLSGKF